MELDASCLRWARVENLERLARALRVPLPMQKRHNREVYQRALVRLIARALLEDGRRPAFAQQTLF
jgi:hypothetical protein